MVIGIDLRCLPPDGTPGAGVAHAARFLTEALVRQNVPWTWKLYIPVGARSPRPPTDRSDRSDRPNGGRGDPAPTIALKDASGSSLRTALRTDPCDVLFVPGGSIAPGLRIPSVPWVHDLAIFSHPEWFPQPFFRLMLTTWLFRQGVMKAPCVFAVSEDTKKEIVTRLKIDPSRIHVTHEGGDPVLASLNGDALANAKREAQKRASGLGISGRFVAWIGTVEPRKNLPMLLDAWDDVMRTVGSSVQLVIAGSSGWKMGEISGEGIVRIKDMNDDTRRDLLLAADLVVLPSLHEGFGLVALEAMLAGTALVASNAAALPEVIGDGGVLLDPTKRTAWRDAMVDLLKDDVRRQQLGEAGKRRSERFSWEETAKHVVDGIKGIAP